MNVCLHCGGCVFAIEGEGKKATLVSLDVQTLFNLLRDVIVD